MVDLPTGYSLIQWVWMMGMSIIYLFINRNQYVNVKDTITNTKLYYQYFFCFIKHGPQISEYGMKMVYKLKKSNKWKYIIQKWS